MPEYEVLVRDGVFSGYACKQQAFEEMYERRTGETRTFDPQVFKYGGCGSRLLLVRDKNVSEVGGLFVPDNIQQKNPPGSGFVISVGDMVGQGTSPHPHGIRCEHPSNLLYQHIVFGMFSGNEYITKPYRDGGFVTEYWVMTDRDIWFVDWES